MQTDILSHCISGTSEERGLAHWEKTRNTASVDSDDNDASTYNFPNFLQKLVEQFPLSRYIPICPTYGWTNKCDIDLALTEEGQCMLENKNTSVMVSHDKEEKSNHV